MLAFHTMYITSQVAGSMPEGNKQELSLNVGTAQCQSARNMSVRCIQQMLQ